MRETNLFYETVEKEVTHRVYKFDNGYGASVVKGYYTYGGTMNLWELAVILFNKDNTYELCFTTPITDNVKGFLKETDVDKLLERIEKLNPISNIGSDYDDQ